MNKPTKIATALLAVFVATCGYLAYRSGPVDYNKGPYYAPNAMHKVQPPPISPENIGNEKAFEYAASVIKEQNENSPLRTTRVVPYADRRFFLPDCAEAIVPDCVENPIRLGPRKRIPLWRKESKPTDSVASE